MLTGKGHDQIKRPETAAVMAPGRAVEMGGSLLDRLANAIVQARNSKGLTSCFSGKFERRGLEQKQTGGRLTTVAGDEVERRGGAKGESNTAPSVCVTSSSKAPCDAMQGEETGDRRVLKGREKDQVLDTLNLSCCWTSKRPHLVGTWREGSRP